MRRSPIVAVTLFALLSIAAPLNAAVWTSEETRLSAPGALALTSPGRQCLVHLPGQRMYAVWFERTGSQSSIIRGSERDELGAWTIDPTTLSLGDSLVRNPSMAVGPTGDLHLAWEDLRDGSEQIFYRHRTADGIWEDEIAITTDEGESLDPVLGVSSSGRVHLIWSDAVVGNKELYHCMRDPGGDFSSPRRLTTHPAESIQPNFVIDVGGDLHVVWQDGIIDGGADINFNSEIWYLPLDADGAPRAAPIRVSRALGYASRPSLALGSDGSLHVVWSDGRDTAPSNPSYFPMAIWYRRWLPGLGFGHEKRFVYSGVDHLNPAVATTPDGTINVVWEDYSHGNSELYYRQINPDTGWDVQATRLTTTVGPTRGPALLADGDGTLHLAWSDAGSGEEGSIRYRTGQADGTTAVRLASSRLSHSAHAVRLEWTTSEELDHAGFLLFLGDDPDGESRPMGDLIRGGPSYALDIPRELLSGASMLKLVALDRFGRLETVALFQLPAPAPQVAKGLVAGPIYPNPARTTLNVSYRTDGGGEVTVELFDVMGRRVAMETMGRVDAGDRQLNWDFSSMMGGGPAAGRYFLRLTTPEGTATRPVVIGH